MKMIIGLGNPGKQYEDTRHNIGFKVIDQLAESLSAPPMQSKFNGMFSTVHTSNGKVLLVKPLTFMNLSGQCVIPLMNYFNVNVEDILVLYDDLDIAPGKIRLRQKGSAGGHNGMKSIISHLGTQDFKRIRIGVGRPTNRMSISDYVLSNFSKEELPIMKEVTMKVSDACEDWLRDPFLEVMNKYNG